MKKGDEADEVDFVAISYSEDDDDGDDLVQRLIVDKAIQRKQEAIAEAKRA